MSARRFLPGLGLGLLLLLVLGGFLYFMGYRLMQHAAAPGPAPPAPEAKEGRKVKYWVSPMDPKIISDKPGKDPMGMDFKPVYEEEGILIPTPAGAQIPMEQVAKIRVYQGPPEIKSEDARLSAWMFVDIRDVDVGSYVVKAKEAIQAKLKLPMGYSIIWSGQFEYMEEARKKLQVVIPVTLVLIVLLVYLNTGSAKETGFILFTLPFAFVGAVWGLYLLKYNLSVAVLVGFIALGGLAAETGAIMLLFLNLSYEGAIKDGRTMTKEDLRESVKDGAVLRLRPLLMTALANMFGLLPIMWSTGWEPRWPNASPPPWW